MRSTCKGNVIAADADEPRIKWMMPSASRRSDVPSKELEIVLARIISGPPIVRTQLERPSKHKRPGELLPERTIADGKPTASRSSLRPLAGQSPCATLCEAVTHVLLPPVNPRNLGAIVATTWSECTMATDAHWITAGGESCSADSGVARVAYLMGVGQPKRPSVLTVRVEDLTVDPGLVALCAGYELGAWRGKQLVDDLLNWLPEFALTHRELQAIEPTDLIRLIRSALENIYKTKKFKRRGELGELLLHAVLRHWKGTIPAISKIYYKHSPNETVKGFDAVHIVANGEDLELWIGEVKLYSRIGPAIRDVVTEIKAHAKTDFLRSEFIAITHKIDPDWTHATKLKNLLDPNTSLDTIFSRTCLPVLLTYDSRVLGAHKEASDSFKEAFQREVRKHHASFAKRDLPQKLRIVLFLVPLHTKRKLVELFNRKLKLWQSL
jgi:hypothetical protein